MRKLFTIETSSEKEWNEVLKSIRESLNDSNFMGFVISVACRIYSLNAFKEWLDALSRECNNSDFYQFWRLDDIVSDPSALKNIIFRKAYKDEEIDVVKEQRNGYARRVEELKEALKEYQYGLVPSLEVECKNQAKEITYLHKKIEKQTEIVRDRDTVLKHLEIEKAELDEANETLKEKCKNQAKEITYLHKKIEKLNKATEALKEKQTEIVRDRDTVLKHLEIEKAELDEANETLKEKCENHEKEITYLLKKIEKQKKFIWYRDMSLKQLEKDKAELLERNKRLMNDMADHLQELDKFRDSIKKKGDNKYD